MIMTKSYNKIRKIDLMIIYLNNYIINEKE